MTATQAIPDNQALTVTQVFKAPMVHQVLKVKKVNQVCPPFLYQPKMGNEVQVVDVVTEDIQVLQASQVYKETKADKVLQVPKVKMLKTDPAVMLVNQVNPELVFQVKTARPVNLVLEVIKVLLVDQALSVLEVYK